MALEPRRYDRILNEAPDDVLGAIFGFLLFESSTAAKDDDGVRARLPHLLPQSPAAAALGLPEHADLMNLRERATVASIPSRPNLCRPRDRRRACYYIDSVPLPPVMRQGHGARERFS